VQAFGEALVRLRWTLPPLHYVGCISADLEGMIDAGDDDSTVEPLLFYVSSLGNLAVSINIHLPSIPERCVNLGIVVVLCQVEFRVVVPEHSPSAW